MDEGLDDTIFWFKSTCNYYNIPDSITKENVNTFFVCNDPDPMMPKTFLQAAIVWNDHSLAEKLISLGAKPRWFDLRAAKDDKMKELLIKAGAKIEDLLI